MTPTVWTVRRRLLGNLVPALFWAPPVLAGVGVLLAQRRLSLLGIGLIALGTILGWLAVNAFGLFENERMRRRLVQILEARGDPPRPDAFFVGFATPSYTGMLDAHEDVGFLTMDDDALTFVSETRSVELPKSAIAVVRFRMNAHTAVGLGRWISVEGEREGRPVRMLIEPREHGAMLANRREGTKLRERLIRWRGIG